MSSTDSTFELDLIRLRLDALATRRLVALSAEEQAEYELLARRELELLAERSRPLTSA